MWPQKDQDTGRTSPLEVWLVNDYFTAQIDDKTFSDLLVMYRLGLLNLTPIIKKETTQTNFPLFLLRRDQ